MSDDYGFMWGPAEVTRLIYVPGRGRVLSVKTNYTELQILISEKGRKLRVWQGDKELV